MRGFVPNPHPNSICLGITLVGAILIALGIMLVVSPAPVLARSTDLSTVVATYPQLDGTALDSCYLCHISTRPNVLNGYGLDYEAADLVAIEEFDSDGDGYLNIDEINALTQPGNPADYPADPHPYEALAVQQYPVIGGTRLESCLFCHTDENGPVLNLYGQDYAVAYDFAGIENDDSDSDGFSNITEINDLKFPGNSADYPTAGHTYEVLVVQQYPAIDQTRLDSCLLCHTTAAGPGLNAYGTAYAADFDFVAIENDDSDGDGLTNLNELNALTFPGNRDLTYVVNTYSGVANSTLDTCDLCHTSNSAALNVYGEAYLLAGRSAAALPDIEDDDADNDDFTNLEEILRLSFPGIAGDPHDDIRALKKYPALDSTRLDACTLCHTDSSGTGLNPYGTDYRDNGRNLAAFALIETEDSDVDSFSNIDEISALTFPGNAGDSPASQHDYEALLVQQYPAIEGTRLTVPDTCGVCHNDGTSTFNDYGAGYAAGFDFAAIENVDSDNDGFVNIDEIDLFFYPGNSADHPDSDLVLFRSLYPDFHNSEQDACILCHTDESGPELNDYGEDYLSHGRSRAALVAIENIDSDGDGYFNLEELELGYCPGVSDCPTHSESLLIQYPDLEGTRLDSCDLCHDTSVTGWPLNSYGNNYLDAGNNRFAFGLIELLDSDEDGYVNIDEINALTMPGDPTDTPAPNSDTNVVFLPIILK